ncbi:unnamed protein product, partial [Choristocarpus tenellus]
MPFNPCLASRQFLANGRNKKAGAVAYSSRGGSDRDRDRREPRDEVQSYGHKQGYEERWGEQQPEKQQKQRQGGGGGDGGGEVQEVEREEVELSTEERRRLTALSMGP